MLGSLDCATSASTKQVLVFSSVDSSRASVASPTMQTSHILRVPVIFTRDKANYLCVKSSALVTHQHGRTYQLTLTTA